MKVIDIIQASKPDIDLGKLNVAVLRVESLVKEYCNRSDIPSALNFVIADMVLDFLSLSDRNINPEAQVTAKSIKEGDVSVEFSTTSMKRSESSLDSILSDYKSQLNKHRKLRW